MAVGDKEADLHHKKNAPDHPPGHEPGDFPPYVYVEYPIWLHHAKDDSRLAKDEHEEANLLSRGFTRRHDEAGKQEAYAAYELEKSDNAAQRAADDRRMSEKAKAEHEAADAAADDHVLDLPVPPADKKKKKE